ARIDRLLPAQIIEARRAQVGPGFAASGYDQLHGHGGRVPAGGRQRAEERITGAGVAQMEWLRIVFAGKIHDLVGADYQWPEYRLLPHLYIVEINHAGTCASTTSGRRPNRLLVTMVMTVSSA